MERRGEPAERRRGRSAPGRALGLVAALAVTALGGAACDGERPAPSGSDAENGARSARVGTVDTVLSVEEELRRFRETLSETPDGLSGGAGSRDALVERFVRAVEVADTVAFREMLMSRGEYAYLYYPHTMYTRPPYYLPPDVLWLQMLNTSSGDLTRLAREMFGVPLNADGYRCDDEPRVEERNRIWTGCLVEIARPDEEPFEIRLFGSILERDGVFKFVSYGNDL